jgi:hypothetical protein
VRIAVRPGGTGTARCARARVAAIGHRRAPRAPARSAIARRAGVHGSRIAVVAVAVIATG